MTGLGWLNAPSRLMRVPLLGLAMAACASTSALAQTENLLASTSQIRDLVVTARKVPEPLQDTPLSLNVVSGRGLDAVGLDTIQEVAVTQPNVSFAGGLAGEIQGEIGIRGIATLVRNIGLESGVGFYVDGVYLGRPDSYNQDLIDIDRIEILRGSQGVTFGKNTIAGVFNIITKQPGDKVEGELRTEVGDYSLGRVDGYLMGPLGDGVSAKLAIGYTSRDGVYRNLSGGQNGDSIGLFSLHGELVYAPTMQDKLTLSYDMLRDRSHPAFYQVTELAHPTGLALTEETTPLTIDNNRPDSLNRDNYGLSLTYERDLGFARLTSISAYRRTAYLANLDDDQNQVDYVSADRFGDTTDLISQELRLSGRAFSKLTYVVGAYYLDQDVSTDRLLAIGNDLVGVPLGNPPLTTVGAARTHSYALFGSVDYALTSRATLSVGLRATEEDKRAGFRQTDVTGVWTNFGLPSLSYAGKTDNSDVAPTVSLSYRLDPRVMVYARVAEGFKSAAFNIDLVSSPTGLAAGPERAITYEVGFRSAFLNRKLRLSMAVFDTAYDDLQVSQLLGAGVVLDNAARANIHGVEADFVASPLRNLRLDASFGYLSAHYDRYQNCGAPASEGGGFTDCSGKTLIDAPELTAHFAAEYAYPVSLGDLVLRTDVKQESPVFFEATNSPRFEAAAHTVADVRMGLRTAKWDFFLWSKNVGDAIYITYRDDRTTAGAPQTTSYGDPRTFGASLTLRY